MLKQPLVGILTTLTSPLLPLLIKSLYEIGVTNLCIIADEKSFSLRDREIWLQRTGGLLDSPEIGIYDFSEKGLPFYLVKNHNGEDCLVLLKKLQPTILINGGTPRKLTLPILNLPKQGVINVHPGELPKYRGSNCVEWAILNNDLVANTAHFMTEEYDEGPIIDCELYEFTSKDNYISIRIHVYLRSVAMMAKTVAKVLEYKLKPADAIRQTNGNFFHPMSDLQIDKVIEKVRLGLYKPIKTSK